MSGASEGISHCACDCTDCRAGAGGNWLHLSPDELNAIVEAAVRKVQAENETRPGAEKHRLAVAIINSLVDIPFVPEQLEARVIQVMIDALIKVFCKFKPYWGKE